MEEPQKQISRRVGQVITLEELFGYQREEMKNVMQCVELRDDHENPIYCPFCGVKIAAGASEENEGKWIVGRCDHLLFTEIDDVGFEYRSERFDVAVKTALNDKTEEEREDLENNLFELVELVQIPNALVFHSIMGPPAQSTASVGFAPIE